MSRPADRLPTRTAATPNDPTRVPPEPQTAEDGTLLEQEAQAQLSGQTALVEATDLQAQYEAAFAEQVRAKEEQVERIEDRLENLIDRQSTRIQQSRSQQPGLLALPGARARWQQKVALEEAVMQRLQGRLEHVREIRDGMGVHGARLDELATRKMRAQEPGLVAEFEDMQEALRRHEALQREQEREKRQRQGRGQTLGLSEGRC